SFVLFYTLFPAPALLLLAFFYFYYFNFCVDFTIDTVEDIHNALLRSNWTLNENEEPVSNVFIDYKDKVTFDNGKMFDEYEGTLQSVITSLPSLGSDMDPTEKIPFSALISSKGHGKSHFCSELAKRCGREMDGAIVIPLSFNNRTRIKWPEPLNIDFAAFVRMLYSFMTSDTVFWESHANFSRFRKKGFPNWFEQIKSIDVTFLVLWKYMIQEYTRRCRRPPTRIVVILDEVAKGLATKRKAKRKMTDPNPGTMPDSSLSSSSTSSLDDDIDTKGEDENSHTVDSWTETVMHLISNILETPDERKNANEKKKMIEIIDSSDFVPVHLFVTSLDANLLEKATFGSNRKINWHVLPLLTQENLVLTSEPQARLEEVKWAQVYLLSLSLSLSVSLCLSLSLSHSLSLSLSLS
ncbi:MAG: hypothetical protein KIT69_20505, partial [Propionibacteriaceae bacterium]|nr:hypothetical protein [Propionibacteriaceae bacterium]